MTAASAFHPELLALPTHMAGERVVVRPFRRGDGLAIFAAVDEDREHLARWLPWVHHHRTWEDSESYARRAAGMWVTREDLAVALFSPSGRFVGGSGLHRFDWETRSFEIGYWLRRSATGQGIVTEATELLTALAFERLAATRVEIRCSPPNAASIAIPRRLGFVEEQILPNAAQSSDGVVHDLIVYACNRESFDAFTWSPQAIGIVRRADGDG